MEQESPIQHKDIPDYWVKESYLRDYFWVSRDSVARLRAAGLPHIGHGRLRRYHLPTVVRWLEQRRQYLRGLLTTLHSADSR